MAVYPVSQHHRRTLLAEVVLQTHHLSLRVGEVVGQLLEQVGRSSLVRFLSYLISLGYACAKENHLAPQVVTLAPSDELVYFGFPFAAVLWIYYRLIMDLMTAVIPQGVRHLKGCSVFSIQFFSR